MTQPLCWNTLQTFAEVLGQYTGDSTSVPAELNGAMADPNRSFMSKDVSFMIISSLASTWFKESTQKKAQQ